MKKLLVLIIIGMLLLIGCETTSSNEKQVNNDITKETISDAVKYYDFGKEYLKNKQYDSAIKNFVKAIEDSAMYRDAFIGLGNAYENKFYFDKAESLYNVLSDRIPSDPAGKIALGYLFIKLKEYDKAENYFNVALEIDSKNANAYFGLGKVYEKKFGKDGITKAIVCYEHACTYNPEDLTIAYKYGKALLDLEKFKKAQVFLEQVVADHPNIVGPISNLAEAYLEAGDYKHAITAFNRTIELDPTIVNAYLGLARSYQGLKDYESAKKSYLELAKFKEGSVIPYLYLGQMYMNIKYYDSAIKYLKTAICIDKNEKRALLLLGQAYFYKGDPKKATTDEKIEYALEMLNVSEAYFKKIIALGGKYVSDAEKGMKNVKQWRKDLDQTRW
ncbi:tetratricopeptide repeat protein [candidate division WOR-3 bacterium]|nr:tetratricopeptide repeat protein [candidate division WOR-3 bacterium]